MMQRKEEQKVDDRHWTDKELENMTEIDWRIFRKDNNIIIKGVDVAPPSDTGGSPASLRPSWTL